MFGRRFMREGFDTEARDKHLGALLHQWRDIEPQPGFDAAVWRRIRTDSIPDPRALLLTSFLREWILPHPIWASAAAAAVAIVAGVLVGVSAPTARASHFTNKPLLHARTLTGTYLAMVTGEAR